MATRAKRTKKKEDEKYDGEETVFASGMGAYMPHENAPDFIIADVVIDVDEFIETLENNDKEGEVRIQIKESKGGKYYACINTYESKKKEGGKKPR